MKATPILLTKIEKPRQKTWAEFRRHVQTTKELRRWWKRMGRSVKAAL